MALLISKITCIPVIAHVRLIEDVDYLNYLHPEPKFLRQIISISPAIAQAVEQRVNLTIIPRTMLLDAYNPVYAEHVVAESTDPQYDFICIGRLCHGKGQNLLMRAAVILAKKGKKLRIAFVGQINEYGTELQALAKQLGLLDSCSFLGHLDNVSPALHKASWLVCPSEFEALGRVLFEAWDHGLPVIVCSSSGGAAESVKLSGGGLAFGAWLAQDLALSLEQALIMPHEERNRLAGAGRKWMRANTNPQAYAKKFQEIIDMSVQTQNFKKEKL